MAVDRFFQQFTIQRKAAGDGRVPGAYADIGTAWGYLQQRASTSNTIGQGLKVDNNYLLMTYPSTDLRQQDRIVYSGVSYVIESGGGPGGIVGLGNHKEYSAVRVDNGQ